MHPSPSTPHASQQLNPSKQAIDNHGSSFFTIHIPLFSLPSAFVPLPREYPSQLPPSQQSPLSSGPKQGLQLFGVPSMEKANQRSRSWLLQLVRRGGCVCACNFPLACYPLFLPSPLPVPLDPFPQRKLLHGTSA